MVKEIEDIGQRHRAMLSSHQALVTGHDEAITGHQDIWVA